MIDIYDDIIGDDDGDIDFIFRSTNRNKFISFCEKGNLSCAKYVYYTYLNCTSILIEGLYESCKNNTYSVALWISGHLTTIENDLLKICIIYNSYEIFKLLLSKCHFTITQLSDTYLTACKNNKIKFIKKLYKNNIIHFENKTEILNTCFYYYFDYNLNTVKLLIELGANPRTNNDMYFKSSCVRRKYDVVIFLCSVIDNYLFEDDKITIMTDEELLKYKINLSKKHINNYKEELIQFTWHPSRFFDWCLSECDKM